MRSLPCLENLDRVVLSKILGLKARRAKSVQEMARAFRGQVRQDNRSG
ncbi:hypothetical protein [Coleofasciculus sp. LEGE 07092]|nr:hypothetical protein [Coleofasciculus sp. LEGE 07092]MBE9148290.1 hypothetical protein [Coleofasciculus sp. LEGE 07092]